MIPNGEKLIGKYLRDNFDASFWRLPSGSDVRVVGEPPPEELRATPWIMLTQLDASNDPEVTPDYLITYFLQADCYAGQTGGQPEALRLAIKTREALAALHGSNGTLYDPGYIYPPGGTVYVDSSTAVVTSVRFSNMARVPDAEAFEPARERMVLDTEVMMHPVT